MGITAVIGMILPLLFLPHNITPQSGYVSGTSGTDISYPNCKTNIPGVSFGIVGVNGGRSYTLNPCFVRQANSFSNPPSLYVNTSWYSESPQINPNSPIKCKVGDGNCLAYNFGYNSGILSYDFAYNNQVRSSNWWLDVETMNSWSDDVVQNRYSLQGTYDALKSRDVSMIGAYSTTYQWNKITGGWKPGWPTWGATVVTSDEVARQFCTDKHFTGGPSLLIQYRPQGSPVSLDYAC